MQSVADNIIDQTKEDSLSGLMNTFDLLSEESFEVKVKKTESLHDIYGLESEHVLAD